MEDFIETFWGENDPMVSAFWEVFVNHNENYDYTKLLSERTKEFRIDTTNHDEMKNLLAGFTLIHLFNRVLDNYPSNPSNVVTKSAHICEAIRYYFYSKKGWDVPSTSFENQCLKLRSELEDEYHPFLYMMISIYTFRNKFEGAHLKPKELRDYEARITISNTFWILMNFFRCLGFDLEVTNNILKKAFDKMTGVLNVETFNLSNLHKIDSNIDRIVIIVKNCGVKNADDIISVMKDFGCKKIPTKAVINATVGHKDYKNLFKKNDRIELTHGAGIDFYNKAMKKWDMRD